MAACPISNDNSFAYVGNGGVPASLYSNQTVNQTWEDTRVAKTDEESDKEQAFFPEPNQKITEATELKVEGNEVELVATNDLTAASFVRNDCKSSSLGR